jgi:hypothetical protein
MTSHALFAGIRGLGLYWMKRMSTAQEDKPLFLMLPKTEKARIFGYML